MDDKAFHEKIADFLKEGDKSESKKAKEEFLKVCTYLPGAYDEDEAFKNLNKEMEKIEKEGKSKTTNRLFYMALPPNVFTVVAGGLRRNCYVDDGNNRIVIEKPFGKDLESSREMMGELKKLWKEEETFREWAAKEVWSGFAQQTDPQTCFFPPFRYRPLPGQGDGQEPPHAQICQPLRRLWPQCEHGGQRADHLQGAIRHRRSWRLL